MAGKRTRASRKTSAAIVDAASSGTYNVNTHAHSVCAYGGSGGNGTVGTLPSVTEIFAAVESLYDDQLQPYGRLIRKRLVECSGSLGESVMQYTDADLRNFCSYMHGLIVESAAGGEWSVLLSGRRADFVDIYDQNDAFPSEFWNAFAAYFSWFGDGANIVLPGGRFLCAQALMQLGLPFLRGYSLGKVCHAVQLAISQKRILGYLDGGVVPYDRSTSRVKQMRAESQQACNIKGDASEVASLTVADWETTLKTVRTILEAAVGRGDHHVPLSNIKRLFRSVYKLELSETALGHTRLTELLHDARFTDICTVELQSRGYVVLPALQRGMDMPELPPTKSWQTEVSNDELPAPDSSRSSLSESLEENGMLRNTFINVAPPPPTPLRQAPSRARSVPRGAHLCQKMMGKVEPVASVKQLSRLIQRVSSEESCLQSRYEPSQTRKFCTDEPLCFEDAWAGVTVGLAWADVAITPTPVISELYELLVTQSEMQSSARFCLHEPLEIDDASPVIEHALVTPTPVGLDAPYAALVQARRACAVFCPDEPLCMQDVCPMGKFIDFQMFTPTPISAY